MPIYTYPSTIEDADVATYDDLLIKTKETRTKKQPTTILPTPIGEEGDLGWRYETVVLPDGSESWEYRPLTLIDLLYPQEEDVVSVNYGHSRIQQYVDNALEMCCEMIPASVVFREMRIDFGLPDLAPLAPDLAMVSGVHRIAKWGTFYVKVEGAKVELVVEITSPSTRLFDVEPSMRTPSEQKRFEQEQIKNPLFRSKWEIYADAGVVVYVVIDDAYGEPGSPPRIYVYRLNGAKKVYKRCTPDKKGRFWVPSVKMYIGVRGSDVVCYDSDGKEIEQFTTMVKMRRVAEERAHYAVERLSEADERAREADERVREADERAREADERAREVQRQTVHKLLATGFELPMVADITGLTLDAVKALAQ